MTAHGRFEGPAAISALEQARIGSRVSVEYLAGAAQAGAYGYSLAAVEKLRSQTVVTLAGQHGEEYKFSIMENGGKPRFPEAKTVILD